MTPDPFPLGWTWGFFPLTWRFGRRVFESQAVPRRLTVYCLGPLRLNRIEATLAFRELVRRSGG